MKQLTIVAVCGILLGGAVSANAQVPRPERPYRGLFRSTGTDVAFERELTLGIGVGGGYDSNLFAQAGFVPDEVIWHSGGFAEFTPDLAFSLNKERVSFGIAVASSSRYFPRFEGYEYLGAHSGSIGVSSRVGRDGRLMLNQDVNYQPFLAFDFFPSLGPVSVGDAQPTAQNRSTPFDESVAYLTDVSFEQRVSRRGSLAFTYEHSFTDFLDDESDTDLRVQLGGARYLHEIARGLAVRIGYEFTGGRYFNVEDERTVRNHSLDIGLDFRRALSFSRQTTLSFGTGSTAVKELGGTRFFVVGDVELNHEIGRTWIASISYDRGVSYVQGFADPFLSNGVQARVTGLVNRRVELTFEGGTAIGNVGFSDDGDTGFSSYTALSSLTYGLTRNLALIGSYTFYRYSFENSVPLPTGLAPNVDRHTAQAMLSFWFPLYQRRGRTNVTG